jgi:hypothetical protein
LRAAQLQADALSARSLICGLRSFHQPLDLSQVAFFVQADEGEPLGEIKSAEEGMRVRDGSEIGSSQAGAQGVERGARAVQFGERIAQRKHACGTHFRRRFKFFAVRLARHFLKRKRLEGGGLASAFSAVMLSVLLSSMPIN